MRLDDYDSDFTDRVVDTVVEIEIAKEPHPKFEA